MDQCSYFVKRTATTDRCSKERRDGIADLALLRSNADERGVACHLENILTDLRRSTRHPTGGYSVTRKMIVRNTVPKGENSQSPHIPTTHIH